MTYKISWSDLKDGYRGFEKLAVRYVQCTYDSKFEHTRDTRDGNKDARLVRDEFTIVIGFQKAEKFPEEWWMEAKFSEEKKQITRYRLDATLVSAILKGTVGRIIFVTNIQVDAQTVNDIRQAITCTTRCKEVDFCTRDCLEYWLYQNPDILKEFFNNYTGESIELSKLMLIDQMEIFSVDKSNLVFRESLRVLSTNRVYVARFSVYAHDSQEVPVTRGSHLVGMRISPKKYKLTPGINQVEVQFELDDNYGYKSKKRKEEHFELPTPTFKFGALEVVSKHDLTVSQTVQKKHAIPSQISLLQQMQECFLSFPQEGGTQLIYISGQSGVGKTHVLDSFIESASKSKSLFFICEMTENQKINFEEFVRCIDFIYFPYLPAGSVSKEYLDCFRNEQFFPQLYYNITCCDHTAESLGTLLNRYISEDVKLFPRRLYVNPRTIIIDNIEKANDLIVNAIYKMVVELSYIKAPYGMILSGQQIRHTSYYTQLSRTVPVLEAELSITVEDCLAMLPMEQINEETRRIFQSVQYFSNMIELRFFTEFLLDHGNSVKDINSFAVLYHLFFKEHLMDAYIGRLFADAIQEDPTAANLCNTIYWNSSGIQAVNCATERKLLGYRVIKMDYCTGRLIPYHDIYKNYYRKHYPPKSTLDIPFLELLDGENTQALQQAVGKLHQAFQKQQFIVVYYSLEPMFRDGKLSVYANRFDATKWYTLFYEYSLSCTHCSMDYSGQGMFKQIYVETSRLRNPSPEVRKICNAALWELTNSTFESLDYKKAKYFAEELHKNTAELVERHIFTGKVTDCVRYHNANVILSMIKSEFLEKDSSSYFNQITEEMLKSGFQDRYWSFIVRYSLTLMQREPKQAIALLSACCDHYDTSEKTSEKYRLWAHFYLSYTKMVFEDDLSQEDNTLLYMEQLHDSFFNDYRKTLFGMVTYFYYRKEVEKGDDLLLSDCYILRKKRPRLQGFFYLSKAARDVVTGDKENALMQLQQAFQIFKDIPSYSKLIQHNISTLKMIGAEYRTSIPLRYYWGGVMEENMYYLDIRGCW